MSRVRFEDILERDGILVYKTKGYSMRPLLRENRDIVIIEKKQPGKRLNKYDVALYKTGEKYVLHRVVGVRYDGYDIRGDNTFRLEDVHDEEIIGVLKNIQRNGKTINVSDKKYMRYVRFWNCVYPVRNFLHKGRKALGKVKRKILKKSQKTLDNSL